MIVIDPGHIYAVESLEGLANSQPLVFIKKAKNDDGVFETVFDGTTNEELIRVLLDRIEYLNKKVPHDSNIKAISHLGSALGYLESRTDDRKRRGVEGTPLP